MRALTRSVLIAAVAIAPVIVAAAPKADKKGDKKSDKKVEEAKPAPPPRTPGPDDAKVTELLGKIASDPAARPAAIAELDKLTPHAIDAIAEFLHRPHQFEAADRKKPLVAIKASVPDKSGRFVATSSTPTDAAAEDAFDWLGGLQKLDATKPEYASLGEVIADDVAIHALANTRALDAATRIFDAAFADDTMLYRDECGRWLRKMEAYAIPTLTRESLGDGDRRRYATFQLERMDRQEPGKALQASLGDEALTIAILDTFRATHHREAVHAVWSFVNADSPRVRAAAREAWMAYVTGPPPPPAPMKRLQLAGGKLTKKPKPLWLTYRELADNELRKAANELLKEDYPLADPSVDDNETRVKTVAIDLEATTKRLFAYFDDARAKAETAQWTEAKQKADAGDLATATAMLDRLLAANPDHGEKQQMAAVYLAWAKQLEAKQQWAEASAAYSKVQGLDPTGPGAQHALAAHHFTLGKMLAAQNKDGGPDFRRAIALDPSYAPAKVAAADAADAESGRPRWMLYAAGSAGVLALLLFGAAMIKRRRP